MDTLVEFRAGKMELLDKTLKPDSRKGLIIISQDEHGMTHFQWQERSASEPETDIIVFPGEASFSKIDRPGTRVFLLKFKEEASRNLFFWAQEPDAAQDDDYCAAVDNTLNMGVEDLMEAEGPAADQPGSAAELQRQPAPAAVPGAAGGLGGGIQASMLASVLSNIMTGGGGATAAQQRQQALEMMGPSLGDVLRPELVAPLLGEPGMVEQLAPFVPEQQRSREAMAEVLASPQFRHQLALFTHALMSGQLDLSQFGLQGQGFGVLEFLKAIQRQADAEAAEKSGQQPAAEQQ